MTIIEKNKFTKIENAVSIGGDGEEMIETTTLYDEPVFCPDTEETREEFKDVFNIPIFHHYVCDKDGNREMEIWYNPDAKPYKFSVHYPRFENSGARLRDCTCFQGFTREQIGMLVYAYSAEEYWKFEKTFMEWSGKINWLEQ